MKVIPIYWDDESNPYLLRWWKGALKSSENYFYAQIHSFLQKRRAAHIKDLALEHKMLPLMQIKWSNRELPNVNLFAAIFSGLPWARAYEKDLKQLPMNSFENSRILDNMEIRIIR